MSTFRIHVVAESPADQNAVLAIARRSLPTHEVELLPARWRAIRGHADVLKVGEEVVKKVDYPGAADLVVLLLDNDGTPPCGEHAKASRRCKACRHCKVTLIVERARVVRTLAAVAVETIETWALLATGTKTPQVQELGKTTAERRRLKRDLYGTEAPSIDAETQRLTEVFGQADLAVLARQSPSFSEFHRALSALAA